MLYRAVDDDPEQIKDERESQDKWLRKNQSPARGERSASIARSLYYHIAA
jgi:hypothetical protein